WANGGRESPRLRWAVWRSFDGRFPFHQRSGKIRARNGGDALADLLAQCPGLDLLDRAVRQVTELERPIRHADQPVHRESEMPEHVADLTVLALTHGKGQPDVGAPLAIERRLDRAVADTVDLDAVAERVELHLHDLAMRTH